MMVGLMIDREGWAVLCVHRGASCMTETEQRISCVASQRLTLHAACSAAYCCESFLLRSLT